MNRRDKLKLAKQVVFDLLALTTFSALYVGGAIALAHWVN